METIKSMSEYYRYIRVKETEKRGDKYHKIGRSLAQLNTTRNSKPTHKPSGSE